MGRCCKNVRTATVLTLTHFEKYTMGGHIDTYMNRCICMY